MHLRSGALLAGIPFLSSCALVCELRRERGDAPWEAREPQACVASPDGHERWTSVELPRDPNDWTHSELRYRNDATGVTRATKVKHIESMARRSDGSVVLVHFYQSEIAVLTREGTVAWRWTHPRCSLGARVAVGYDDAVLVSCGPDLIRVSPGGKPLWRARPFGDRTVFGPVRISRAAIDKRGTAYVSGAGEVAAVTSEGLIRWRLRTGFNRGVRAIGWLPNQNLLFRTSMGALHTATQPRVYFVGDRFEERFEVTRAGNVVKRERLPEWGKPPPPWPTALAVPPDGTNRAP